jgi:5'-phosphate synthase pdxT subunit
MESMNVGILALQGAFREHRRAFGRLGVDASEVRLPRDLSRVQALVIPGGESTTMAQLMLAY